MAKNKVKDVNLYTLKTMTDRVAEYVNTGINGAVIRKRMQERIQNTMRQVQYHEKNATGEEPLKMFTKEESAMFAVKYRQELAILRQTLADQLRGEALFAYTKGDESLYANYKKFHDEVELRKAIAQWFLPYTPEGADPVTHETPFVCKFAETMLAQKKPTSHMARANMLAKDKTLVLTKGLSKKQFLDLYYSMLAECIIDKIPSFVRALSPDEKALFQKKQSETAQTAQA